MKCLSFTAFVVSFLGSVALAQGQVPRELPESVKKQMLELEERAGRTQKERLEPVTQDHWTLAFIADDPEAKRLAKESIREELEYEGFHFAHWQRVYWWQFISSIAIFMMVFGLVLAGTYFAYLQLRRDLEEKSTEPSITELAFGPSMLTVKSPVLGTIILALSMGFLYLYLFFVYPITLGPGARTQQPQAAQASHEKPDSPKEPPSP